MNPAMADLLRNRSAELATVGEYAAAGAMSVDEVISDLTPLLEGGMLAIESADGELFVLTCPKGRSGAVLEPPANLWEDLRRSRTVSQASREWRLYRVLERSGWRVVVEPQRWLVHLTGADLAVSLGVVAAGKLAPLLDSVSAADIRRGDGPLGIIDRAGVDVAAITCPQHKLDEYVTAVRAFHLSKVVPTPMVVLVLEAPRFQPVVVTAADKAIDAISLIAQTPEGSV